MNAKRALVNGLARTSAALVLALATGIVVDVTDPLLSSLTQRAQRLGQNYRRIDKPGTVSVPRRTQLSPVGQGTKLRNRWPLRTPPQKAMRSLFHHGARVRPNTPSVPTPLWSESECMRGPRACLCDLAEEARRAPCQANNRQVFRRATCRTSPEAKPRSGLSVAHTPRRRIAQWANPDTGEMANSLPRHPVSSLRVLLVAPARFLGDATMRARLV